MATFNENLSDADACVRAALHKSAPSADWRKRDARQEVRSILWKLAEVAERLGSDGADMLALRQVGDRLTGEVGAAERVAQIERQLRAKSD